MLESYPTEKLHAFLVQAEALIAGAKRLEADGVITKRSANKMRREQISMIEEINVELAKRAK